MFFGSKKISFFIPGQDQLTKYFYTISEAAGEVLSPLNRFKLPSKYLLTLPRWYFFCGSYLFMLFTLSNFFCMIVLWPPDHHLDVHLALCILFVKSKLALWPPYFNSCSSCFPLCTSVYGIYVLYNVFEHIFHYFHVYKCVWLNQRRSWGQGWYPVEPVWFYITDLSKAVLLIWCSVFTCFCVSLCTAFLNLCV